MKLNEVIKNLGRDKSVSIAKQIAHDLNIQWTDGVGAVFNTIVNDSDRAPINIGSNSDGPHEVIEKWLLKYQAGKDGRASQRRSNLPGTISDPILERIIESRISKISESDLHRIIYAHRLSMSAENILGLILEEYLADNLEPFGWHCAWGETVKSVDFVHTDGRLLQVKNRSNSENSSSSAIRDGTQIKKWFRIKADRIEYRWETLNELCGSTSLSEDSFVRFVQITLKNNPACLAIEDGNPWS